MFCSKCGKTLIPEEAKCPHCGSPVAGSRFLFAGYTSAQGQVASDAPAEPAQAYTRTSYTTMSEEEKQEGSVDSRTSYRPVFEEDTLPQDVREGMRTTMSAIDSAAEGGEQEPESEEPARPQTTLEDLPEEALNTLSAVDEELQMEQVDVSELRARPVESSGRAGISAEVEKYVQRLEASENRRTQRRGRRGSDVDEEALEGIGDAQAEAETERPQPRRQSRRQARAAEAAPVDAEPAAEEAFEDEYDAADAPEYNPDEDGYDDGYDAVDEDEYDGIDDGRSIGVTDILKVALIMVLAAALIVGGVLAIRSLRGGGAAAPIEGVTDTLYDQGLAAVKGHTEATYVNELINIYKSETITGFTQRVTQDSAAIDALLPAEPQVNDALFVSALQAIQSNIGNAILMDAVESQQGTGTDTSEGSASRWAIVNNAISQLEAASTAQELTAILNGEQITAATSPTPSPTPQATYSTLVKDDKSDAVLEMQNRLYILGFLLDDRDGQFGSKTQTAVKAFQQAAGLPVTGIADNETLTLLYSEDAPRTEYAQVTPTPRPVATPEPESEPETGSAEATEEGGATVSGDAAL